MKINASMKRNFKTLCKAVIADAVCLMDAREVNTGKSVVLVCAVNKTGKEYEFVPFAVMIDGNPYEMYDPPNTEGGYSVEGKPLKVTRRKDRVRLGDKKVTVKSRTVEIDDKKVH